MEVKDDDADRNSYRPGDDHMAISDRDGGHRLLPLLGREGREEVLGPGARTGGYNGGDEGSPSCSLPPGGKIGAALTAFLKTTREWWLTAACLLLILTQFWPQATEYAYPIIDWRGGNRLSMATNKEEYSCGEMVNARFTLQKQQNAVGQIKWELVRDEPEGRVYLYTHRVAAAPVGIIDHWAGVEKLPDICEPGKYYFAGTLSYPVLFGTVSYTLRTTKFTVKGMMK
jgi:hypothetical protein